MTDFHIADVFATDRYAGNQLAVVESDGTLDGDEMQAIAAEMGFSETTFVESRGPPYRVRIFTPTDEIPFAGHPTLGTAAVIRDHVVDGTPDEIVLDLDVGEIPVAVGETDGPETYWMTQQAPEFGETLAQEDLADLLSLDATDLDADWPVQVVSTGLPTLVVPLTDRDGLERAAVDDAAYERVTGDREAKNVLAFCADPRKAENDLAVRVFAPGLGVPEDPATGSSNGCLAGYLARHAYFGSGSLDARVEQGYELGRPSLLHLAAVDRGESVDVEVGGRVVPVATGELL
ncbi:PhzF family phenazine biosynthesis protein [Halobacteriales archaeon Cl-PHB]